MPKPTGMLGAPAGTIPTNLAIAYGRGAPWADVNRYDAHFLKYGTKYGVPPAMLKAMSVIESGGQSIPNGNGFPNWGVMQLTHSWNGGPETKWERVCKKLGLDFKSPEGQIATAAYVLGGHDGDKGTPEQIFLSHYYPIPGGLDVKGPDGHTQRQYLADMDALIAIINAAADGTTPATSTTPAPTVTTTTTPKPKPDPWRPYPYPPMVRLIVQKPAEGAGFDRVASRKNRIRGFSTHITDGTGSIEWLASFFSTGGERAWDALTDTCIGRDGRIGLLNDWRDDKNGGTRAGWANGGVDGLEGDGTAFYRAFPDINSCLVSCEHVARSGEAWTDAMLESTIELRTAIAQELKCPWDAYPYHPAYGGVSIEQQHRNFATKSCPANPYINQYDAVVKREVKAKLKAWQGGEATGPAPTPEPVWFTRFGFSLEDIESFFGTITRHNQDGTTDELAFNPEGALSLLWLNRCDKEGKFPEAERIWYSDAKFVDGQEMWASWVGGWMAYLPLVDSRASWQWLDDAKP